MKKTQNFQLNQWEATDKISREDFNADNTAIDAALSKLAVPGFVVGSYTGNGLELSAGGLHVELGFRPRFVAISKGWYTTSGLSASTFICTEHPNSGAEQYFTLDDTGFTVGLCSAAGTLSIKINTANNTYDFIAIQ